MNNAELQEKARAIMRDGPNRVLCPDGAAHPCRRAREEHGTLPSVIFIRNDGWSLGAPESLEWEAYRQWSDQWAGFLRRPETSAKLISEYRVGTAIESHPGVKPV